MRIDIGCGHACHAGFVGLDRYPLAGVSVVADLDRGGLPFRADVFDTILAFHSLEHVADLPAVMRELWRVARNGAQVVVVGPYHAMGLNLANPYHEQVFNEHTPRFWTHWPTSALPGEEYQRPPQGGQWGLARSDNSEPGMDFRLAEMQFFYFSELWGLPPEVQRERRRHQTDVCEQILFRLQAVKPVGATAPAIDWTPFEPPALAGRRQAAAARSRRRFSLPRLLRRLWEMGLA